MQIRVPARFALFIAIGQALAVVVPSSSGTTTPGNLTAAQHLTISIAHELNTRDASSLRLEDDGPYDGVPANVTCVASPW